MLKNDIKILGSKILLMGITFKENCPDIRNTRVIDIYNELRDYDIQVDVYDPWADPEEVKREYNIDMVLNLNQTDYYQGLILAVSHDKYLNFDFRSCLKSNGIIYDVKGVLPKNITSGRL
jgi:UDP-N-acetyl-D-galactosamine dehydrogenase